MTSGTGRPGGRSPGRTPSPRVDAPGGPPSTHPSGGQPQPRPETAAPAQTPDGTDTPPTPTSRRERRESRQPSLLNASAIMAAGTVVSRLTGFGRAAIIAAAIGLTAVTADVFNVPNVIPNMLYILVGGGVLNSVLVPAMVRAIKNDADGGEAYSQRLFSITVVGLGAATLLAVLAAPLLIRLIAGGNFGEPDMRPFFDNMVMFARFCLPQIFFYGLYVLIGQLLNAKGRFGPMMWAPIVNNVVAIGVFGTYLVVSGPKGLEPFTDGEILLLGLGSTVGVLLQAVCLVPVLRSTGFTMRFRRDWRGHGLGHTARLGMWTFWFVAVNQLAYLFVVRVASSASAVDGADGAGYTVYANAILIIMVPHSVLTVSLATALLPRMSDHAHFRDFDRVRSELSSALRTCLAMIVPVGALMAALSLPMAALIFDHGAASGQTDLLGLTLAMLVPGLIAFTVHYMILRGFYALQDTRTPFLTQLWVSGAMIAGALLIAFAAQDNRVVTMLLAGSYSIAYIIGATVGLLRLQQQIGSLEVPLLVAYVARLVVIGAVAGGMAYLVYQGFEFIGLSDILPGFLANLVILAVCGGIGAATFVGVAYVAKVAEVRKVIELVLSRVRGRSAGAAPATSDDVELDATGEIDLGQYLDDTVDARMVETGTLSIFRRRDLDPEMTMEFFLDETLPGVPRHWDTTSSTPVVGRGGPGGSGRPGPGSGGPGVPPGGAASVPGRPGTPPPAGPSAGPGGPPRRPAQPTMAPYGGADPTGRDPRGRVGVTSPAHAGRVEITETTDPDNRLAGRYRVEELLDESDGVRSWRAVDTVLHRHVFVHTIASGDSRVDEYVAAARRAAGVDDPRFLRVLDVGSGDVDFIVREWTPAPSLAAMLAGGPLHPDEAAAIGAEVAEALTTAHAQDLSHQALDPAEVFILPDGTVKIGGLETNVVLHGRLDYGLEDSVSAAARDTAAIGGILYAGLTARWPWGARAGLSAAPRIDGRLATPRQVRPGVPRGLDAITDRAVGSVARHHEPILGTPAAVAAELDSETGPRYAYDAPDEPGSPPALIDEGGATPLLRTRAVPAAPMSRRERRSGRTGRILGVITAAVLLIGAALVGLQLLLAAIEGPDDESTAPPPATSPGDDPEESEEQPDEAEVGPLPIAEALDFDPSNSGGNDEENPQQAADVHDGDPDTAWQTVDYYSPLEDQKDGVGLFVRLEDLSDVTGLTLILDPSGADLEIRVAPADASDPPGSYDDWSVVATIEEASDDEVSVTLDEPASTQYVLVWFTRLPQADGGDYKGGIAELEVLGRVS